MVLSLFFYGYKGSENTPQALSTIIKDIFSKHGWGSRFRKSFFAHISPYCVEIGTVVG